MKSLDEPLPILLLVLSIALGACSVAPIEASTATPTVPPTPTAAATATPLPPPPTTTPAPTLGPCEDEDPYNGWLYHGTCIPGLVTEEFWLSPNPNHFIGNATYYDKGVMESVLETRGMSMDDYYGAVALMHCGDIGKSVYIKKGTNHEWEGPYLVADCSGYDHLYFNVVEAGLAVEVDWETSRRWNMQGGIAGVHVCKNYPYCGYASTLRAWFLHFVEWEDPEVVPTSIPEYVLPVQNWNHDNDPLNGYFQPDRGWIPGMITEGSWNIPHPAHSYGSAVWYAMGVMRATAHARGYSLDGYLDGVSLLSPADLGETVWMRQAGGKWEGPYLVVDCTQINHHFAAAYYQKEVVEIGWDTAIKWGMVDAAGNKIEWSRLNVEVYKGIDEPSADIGFPVYYPDWWLNQVTFQ